MVKVWPRQHKLRCSCNRKISLSNSPNRSPNLSLRHNLSPSCMRVKYTGSLSLRLQLLSSLSQSPSIRPNHRLRHSPNSQQSSYVPHSSPGISPSRKLSSSLLVPLHYR